MGVVVWRNTSQNGSLLIAAPDRTPQAPELPTHPGCAMGRPADLCESYDAFPSRRGVARAGKSAARRIGGALGRADAACMPFNREDEAPSGTVEIAVPITAAAFRQLVELAQATGVAVGDAAALILHDQLAAQAGFRGGAGAAARAHRLSIRESADRRVLAQSDREYVPDPRA